MIIHTWQLVVAAIAGWVNNELRDVIAYMVYVAGVDSDTSDPWMKQIARNLTDSFDGFLMGKAKLIRDRDPRFTWDFRQMLKAAGLECIRLPARSPNLNAYAERFVRSIKSECLSKMLFFSEAALRRAICEYIKRNHQGLDNRLIRPPAEEPPAHGPVECRKRLGGLLKFHCRRAA
jgi:hypothetical protein